ncbi:MAG: DUF4382 domain-containing protein [Gemmatimonadota bacterium]
MLYDLRLHRTPTMRYLGIALVASLFALPGCDDDGPTGASGDATFQVMLTGASGSSAALADGDVAESNHDETPATGDRVAAAEVWISQVYLVGGGDGRVDLFVAEDEDDLLYFDLMDLAAGVDIEFTEEVPVPDGEYGQLRFVVDSAHVTLKDEHIFADGSQDKAATVPSDALRVNLNPEFQVEEGETHILLVDFDLSRGFVFTGPPFAAHGVLVKPVLFQQAGQEVQ